MLLINPAILLDFSPPHCSAPYRPLGMQDGAILDSQITASSETQGFESYKARLDGPSCWRGAKNSPGEYLEVNFGRKEYVKAIRTQADPRQDNWTKKFYIAYSLGSGWKNITEPYNVRVKVCSSYSNVTYYLPEYSVS